MIFVSLFFMFFEVELLSRCQPLSKLTLTNVFSYVFVFHGYSHVFFGFLVILNFLFLNIFHEYSDIYIWFFFFVHSVFWLFCAFWVLLYLHVFVAWFLIYFLAILMSFSIFGHFKFSNLKYFS